MKVKCPNCGHVNTEEQLEHWNGTNEEGEEYVSLELDCAGCNKTIYEGSEWGHWNDNDSQDIYEEIEDHFKTSESVSKGELKAISLSPGHGWRR